MSGFAAVKHRERTSVRLAASSYSISAEVYSNVRRPSGGVGNELYSATLGRSPLSLETRKTHVSNILTCLLFLSRGAPIAQDHGEGAP